MHGGGCCAWGLVHGLVRSVAALPTRSRSKERAGPSGSGLSFPVLPSEMPFGRYVTYAKIALLSPFLVSGPSTSQEVWNERHAIEESTSHQVPKHPGH